MAVESPVCIAVLQGVGDAQVTPETARIATAGFQLLMALAITIESPVIDLLSTSTTLARNRQNYEVLSRFAWHMMAVVTAVHGLIVFTPLYDLVTRSLLDIPVEVATAVHNPMKILLFWSAAVGWRRYLQGLMIRQGMTKPISIGTVVRMIAISGVGFGLSIFTDLDKLMVVSLALLCSVFSEAIFIHAVSRNVIRLLPPIQPTEEPLTLARLYRFHAPLTASTFVTLISMPMVSAALARSSMPVASMAAWQVGFSLIWLFRTCTFALPEAVIALYTRGERQRTLAKFCLSVGVGLSVVMTLVHLTRLDALYFLHILDVEDEGVRILAATAVFACASLPLINALMSGIRGFLTAEHVTSVRLYAITGGVASLAACLWLGNAMKWPGVLNASFAVTFSQIIELIILATFWLKLRARLEVAPA